MSAGLRVLICDDEPLARLRLRQLLQDCTDPPATVVAEAADAVQAMSALAHHGVDGVLLDIHLPGADGMGLARALAQARPSPPPVVFVTADATRAVEAFALDAVDYLTKPVRLERLQHALQKMQRFTQISRAQESESTEDFVLVHGRGRTERVALRDVLYFKAELKYLTLRTANAEHILEGSLNDWQTRLGEQFLRIHRNALVARHALRSLQRGTDPVEGEVWQLGLVGVPERLTVSRRQLPLVRAALGGGSAAPDAAA